MSEEELKAYIGKMIKKYRNKKGLTQGELGEKIGVKNNSVSAYERGAVAPDSNILFAIGSALEIRVDDLFPPMETEIGYLDKIKDKRSKNLSTEDMYFLQKLIEKAASMEDNERKKFLESMRFTVDFHEKMKDDNPT